MVPRSCEIIKFSTSHHFKLVNCRETLRVVRIIKKEHVQMINVLKTFKFVT